MKLCTHQSMRSAVTPIIIKGRSRMTFLAALLVCLPFTAVPEGTTAQVITTPLHSEPLQGEIDTADRGDQIGGIQVGIDYALRTLRCPSGQVMVGMRTGVSDVLVFLEVTCAPPACTRIECSWTSTSTIEAGSQSAGRLQSQMLCKNNEMISGIRGRVITRSNPRLGYNFDYAADLEIECARMNSPGALGMISGIDAASANWRHPTGELTMGGPGGVVSDLISCRPNGGVTAVSLGISRHFERRGERVLQAVSLYCPVALPRPYSELSLPAQQAARQCLQKISDPTRDWRAVELCIIRILEVEPGRLPNFFKGSVTTWGRSNVSYNCYAYAINPDQPGPWIGPRAPGDPARPGDIHIQTPQDFLQQFTSHGFTEIKVTQAPLAPGEERAVIYYNSTPPYPIGYTHAALWTSTGVYAKIGELGVFRFDNINQMTGGSYGQIVKMFRR